MQFFYLEENSLMSFSPLDSGDELRRCLISRSIDAFDRDQALLHSDFDLCQRSRILRHQRRDDVRHRFFGILKQQWR